MDGVVDYAVHPSRSDWMDVFLCAEARFFVGNTSGLYLLATAFGTRCALANVSPSSHLAFAPADVSILKLIWSDRLSRYLTFPEIFSRPVANYRFSKLFAEHGLRVDENTEEELRELVVEMLDRVAGSYSETSEERALQKQFFSLLRPWHYGHGAVGRIGAGFLRRHRDLLKP
jgi:putative glycosyltransferase (TIGR04372 family)